MLKSLIILKMNQIVADNNVHYKPLYNWIFGPIANPSFVKGRMAKINERLMRTGTSIARFKNAGVS